MQRKLILVPAGLLLLLLSVFCFFMVHLSYTYTLPEKAFLQLETSRESYITRADYVKPTEAPTEPPVEEEMEEQPAPVAEKPYTMQLDMAAVASHHAANPDVVGWIKISGTVINYPIMYSGDNDFYVHHSWNKASSQAGAIFADFRCRMDKSDNIILYGHNMGNGSMFHAIKNYKSANWGRSNAYIEIATLEHRYLYKVLSCNVLSGVQGAKFDYWNYVDMNRTNYNQFITNIKNTALVWYGDDKHLPRDNYQKLITLQTCNSGANDGIRCVVFAYCVGER